MRLCRAEAEVDKLAEALREQSRICAPDMKNKLLAEGSKIQGQSDEVRKRLCRAVQSPPLQWNASLRKRRPLSSRCWKRNLWQWHLKIRQTNTLWCIFGLCNIESIRYHSVFFHHVYSYFFFREKICRRSQDIRLMNWYHNMIRLGVLKAPLGFVESMVNEW